MLEFDLKIGSNENKIIFKIKTFFFYDLIYSAKKKKTKTQNSTFYIEI